MIKFEDFVRPVTKRGIKMIEIKIDDEIYTEEQYKRDYVRMMDSLRQDRLGEKNCYGIDCAECPLEKIDHIYTRAFEQDWFDREYKDPKGEKENG